MLEPTRDGVVVVGADDGGGVRGQLRRSAGDRVRFVGHAEHVDVVDLVAEHHHAAVREVLYMLDTDTTQLGHSRKILLTTLLTRG